MLSDFALSDEQRFVWEATARFAQERVAPDAAHPLDGLVAVAR